MAETKKYFHNLDVVNNKVTNLLLNPLTTSQRTSLSLGLSDQGYVCYDTDLNKQYFWDGTQWIESGTTETLQEVTDNGNTTTNDIIINGNSLGSKTGSFPNNSNFYFSNIPIPTTTRFNVAIGYGALENNTANNCNVIGFEAGKNNTGSQLVAIGDSCGINNTGDTCYAIGNSLQDNSGNFVNAFGQSAANSNTGSFLVAIGDNCALNNAGTRTVFIGQEAGVSNSADDTIGLGYQAAKQNGGNNVNAFGSNAGENNTYSYVNLFGNYANATANGQTVLSKDGTIMERLGTSNLSVDRMHEFPDDDGTFALSVNGQYADSSGAITIPVGTGTVTSVGLSMPSAFSVSNSPVTTSGTLTVTGAGLTSQYVRGDGTLANFPANPGGGSSVSYYLNGSVNQGIFGGNTYYEMSRTANTGATANFIRTSASGNGYIAQFITSAGDPALLNIPAGNWDFQVYFSASSNGGNPQFYAELYKYNGTFTLIASGSTSPETITGGTIKDVYISTLTVPATTLLVTDRLAIRIYVIPNGRNITMYTQDNNLAEVHTTFSTGLAALNGLTTQVQYFATGTTGTDFNISSVTDTHTFNLPVASATNTGKLSNTDWNTFNGKQAALSGTGLVKSTSGTISYITDNSTNWDTAYTNRITSLTTTGSSGSATLVSNTLNIPTYTLSGLGGQPLNTNLTSLSGLTYASTSFVKMTAAGTFALDTNTYLTGNQSITLSGDVTGSGTTSITTAISNTTVTGKLLTGYVSGAGTISATDSILSAIQKLNGNISGLSSTYFPLLGGSITGTAGAGFFGAISQSSNPSTPTSGFRLYADSSNRLSWIGTNGFVRTFDGTSNTASRTYTLPDASGTIALTSDLSSYVPTSRTLTINGTTFDLSANRSWTISTPSAADPTGTIGLTAVNGSASTFMRSDAAPALSQSIAPTWTGFHTFSRSATASGGIARGTLLSHNLTAAANSNVLVGLDINNTFNNGSFADVGNLDLRVNRWAQISTSSTAQGGLVIGATTFSGSVPNNGFRMSWHAGTGQTLFNTGNGSGYYYDFATNSGVSRFQITDSRCAVLNVLTVNTSTTTDAANIGGNLSLVNAGNKIKIATGTNASAGTGTLNGSGTATISTTAVTANSLIQITPTGRTTGNVPALGVGVITAGTSFTVVSSNAIDSGTFTWFIIN